MSQTAAYVLKIPRDTCSNACCLHGVTSLRRPRELLNWRKWMKIPTSFPITGPHLLYSSLTNSMFEMMKTKFQQNPMRAVGWRDVAILSTSANDISFHHMTQRQNYDDMFSVYGGFTRVSWCWWSLPWHYFFSIYRLTSFIRAGRNGCLVESSQCHPPWRLHTGWGWGLHRL